MSEASEPTTKAEQQDQIVSTSHSLSIGGKTLKYTATTGILILKKETLGKGEKEGQFEGHQAKARVFFTAYTKDDESDPSKRPITFAFNGGPGSSSVWLHLGCLGPRRVMMNDTELVAPPYKLTNNEYSLLDESDIVFIDPVGTGFSRPQEGEKASQFHTLAQDIESVGEFIRLYCSRHQRWLSPKFLAGESYGTTRAAGLVGHLQEKHGMYLNGIMLISVVLDFTTLLFAHNNDLPYILYIPSYAATAHYHKKLPKRLQDKPLADVLKEVEAFTFDDYAAAVLKGSSLDKKEQKRLARKLSDYTGLSQDFIERCNLRIELMRFCKELLREERTTVGRLDSRFKGKDRDSAGEHFEYDPSYSAIMGPYSATINDYVKSTLEFSYDLPYEILSMEVNRNWKWENDNKHVNVADTLSRAMNMNPHLKVHVANGYYDLATPHFATEHTLNHLGIDEETAKNISSSYYEAGHMMYLHEASLKNLKENLAHFIKGSLG
ncbi:MAG: peptidase S10 [Trueperaceae bacterium]|nr:peptidase S10 [Trueperaceae bacterium]